MYLLALIVGRNVANWQESFQRTGEKTGEMPSATQSAILRSDMASGLPGGSDHRGHFCQPDCELAAYQEVMLLAGVCLP